MMKGMNRMRQWWIVGGIIVSIGLLVQCSTDRSAPADQGEKGVAKQSEQRSAAGVQSELSDFELEHGIGPIKKKLILGEINPELVEQGKEIFEIKCLACHELDDRRVGPPLGDVLERRTPEFVMNMILNPDEMIKKHPVAKQMLAEYLTVMTYQNVTVQQARAILEYLRWVHEQRKKQ